MRKLGFLFVLMIILVLVDSANSELSLTFNRAIPSPDSNAFALGYGDDGFLWVHGQDSGLVYQLDPLDGNVIKSFPSNYNESIDTLNDVDVSGGVLYGGGEPTIYRYDTSSGSQLKSLIGPVIGGSRGLTFIVTDMYVSGVLKGYPGVRLGLVDPATGNLLDSFAPPDLLSSNGIGRIGQNIGYLVEPSVNDEEYGDIILNIVNPKTKKLLTSQVLFQGYDDIHSLDSSNNELFISRRELNEIWVYTINSPTIPRLIYPLNGLHNLGTEVTFIWQKSSPPGGDSITYDIHICADENFKTGCIINNNIAYREKGAIYYANSGTGLLLFGIVAIGGIKGRKGIAFLTVIAILAVSLLMSCGSSGGSSDNVSVTVSGLDQNTTYFWKVAAKDNYGITTESEIRSFTTR